MSTLIIGTPRKVSLTGPAGPCNNCNQGKLARVPKEIASLMAARASGTSPSIISLGFREGGGFRLWGYVCWFWRFSVSRCQGSVEGAQGVLLGERERESP